LGMTKYTFTEKKDTRSNFSINLHELNKQNENIINLYTDLTDSLKMNTFKKDFPERFFQMNITKTNIIELATGMTIKGKIPFTGTFANFSTDRVYDQIHQSITYSGKNVKICTSHTEITLSEDGTTHQILKNISMMKMLPNMTMIIPCDYNQTKLTTLTLGKH